MGSFNRRLWCHLCTQTNPRYHHTNNDFINHLSTCYGYQAHKTTKHYMRQPFMPTIPKTRYEILQTEILQKLRILAQARSTCVYKGARALRTRYHTQTARIERTNERTLDVVHTAVFSCTSFEPQEYTTPDGRYSGTSWYILKMMMVMNPIGVHSLVRDHTRQVCARAFCVYVATMCAHWWAKPDIWVNLRLEVWPVSRVSHVIQWVVCIGSHRIRDMLRERVCARRRLFFVSVPCVQFKFVDFCQLIARFPIQSRNIRSMEIRIQLCVHITWNRSVCVFVFVIMCIRINWGVF